ncbi:hypothetical protein [Lysobacter fragariae]
MAECKFKANDVLKLEEAAAIYAERDRRRSDDDKGARGHRGALDRARKAIEYAALNGKLKTTGEDQNSFRRDFFAYWASSNKPKGKSIEWVGDFANTKWSERFEGLYEVPQPVVHELKFEVDYQYPEEVILQAPIPIPTVEAPAEWVEALGFAKFQNDALRKKIAELEGEVNYLKHANAGRKGGLS